MIILMTKKYSGPIVLGDYAEKGSVCVCECVCVKPCFLCMWDSRDRAQHYTKDWPLQEELVPCKERNVINDPLHIKLGLIKQLTKALDKDGGCFTYLCKDFPGLTMEKLKTGIFDGPQIRQLIRDPEFENSMNEVKLEAWKAFVLVVKNFFGNNKDRNYAQLVNNMLPAFRNLGCDMSVKMHYLFSHMDRFPENLVSKNDELGERFHQDLKEMETRYQGRWNTVMMADYCWNLKKDFPAAEHSRSSKKRKFKPWSLNNGEETYNLRVLTFINAHHSVYSNRCFYQVINICCWQNIFSLKNIFWMVCVDKNQQIMAQKCNRFCQKIWFFQINLAKNDEEKRMPFPNSAVQKYPKSVVEISTTFKKSKNCCPVLLILINIYKISIIIIIIINIVIIYYW